uniref:Uncharacterized protein n=1 Tax=Kalanchoe fedtschenkoi TaxID=63787 RepID=A0A7N0ZU67_KALFE
MKPVHLITQPSPLHVSLRTLSSQSSDFSFIAPRRRSPRRSIIMVAYANSAKSGAETTSLRGTYVVEQLNREDASGRTFMEEVRTASVPVRPPAAKMSLNDQAFWLLSFIACTTSIAFTGLVVAAVPTLFAMARAATSLSKLADTAREELPSTMAALRLSSMEISDLTLELSELSHEITDGVAKSSQAVQAAKAGIGQMGSIAHQKTMSMIEERANLPPISLQPVVAGAAKKTSQAVGRATKTLMNIIYRGEQNSDDTED